MQSVPASLKTILDKKHPLTRQILAGSAPENIIEYASKGLLPIPRYEILEILIYLITNESPLKDEAANTLQQYKAIDLIDILSRADLLPATYDYYAERSKRRRIFFRLFCIIVQCQTVSSRK